MGRNLERTESALQFDKYYRGCIFGLLPLQFQSFKKLLPHIKQKHVTASKSGSKTDSNESDEGQSFEAGSSDSSFTAMKNTRENISILQTPKKDSSRKGNHHQRPRFQRTYSIHHLEPPSNYLEISTLDTNGSGESDNIASQPRIKDLVEDDEQVACNSNYFGEQELPDQAAVDEDSQLRDHSGFSCETYEDFFHVFQIDKRLLMKTAKNQDSADSAHSQGEVKSHRRESLRRSGSFPMSIKPYGNFTPSKLENKVTEVWPSSSSSSSSSTSTSSSSFHCSENILPRSLSCTLPVNISGELDIEKTTQYETDHSALDYSSIIRRYKLSRIKRVSSLNNSMERYTHLFDTSSRRDARLSISKSLRLSNEDRTGFNPTDLVYLRKVQSMREGLRVECPSDSIEFSKLSNTSANLSIESEQSASDWNKDESCLCFDQQLSCSNSLALTLTDELQIKSVSDPYSNSLQQLSEEAIKTAISDQEDFPQEGASRIDETVNVITFKYDQHAINILDALASGNSLNKSTKLNNELDEQLFSDLVNEALIDVHIIYDAYWPSPLCWSSNCLPHPIPATEQHVTLKVLSKIQKLQSFSLKTGNSMDDVISFDLAQGNGWMNLQADAESLGLTLDEMIFDELIDELVYE